MSLRVGYVGNFDQPFCTEQDFTWELQQLGHSVVQVQERDSNVAEVVAQLKDCDFVMYSHTHGRPVIDVFDSLHAMGIPTVAYHLDLFHGVEKAREVGQSEYWKVKYWFSVDNTIVPILNADPSLPTAFYLPAGVVSRDTYLASPRDDMRADIAFVGSQGYHPQWPYRGQLIEWLKATYGDRFVHYGNDGKRYIRMGELNELYASVKVVVGDSLCHDFTYESYWSDRPYETTGRGGFIIMPRVPGLDKEFIAGKEMIFYNFGDFEQLKKLIDYFVEHDEVRETIRHAGFEKTRDNYTYKHRLTKLLDILCEEESQLKAKR